MIVELESLLLGCIVGTPDAFLVARFTSDSIANAVYKIGRKLKVQRSLNKRHVH